MTCKIVTDSNSFAAVGQMPFLDFLLDKNPVMRIGPPNLANITRISLEHLIARLQGKDENFDPEVPDFLQHFIESKTTNPDLVNDGTIMGYLLVNLLAGADTTAITIRAFFWYCLHNPSAYRKLEKEILDAGLEDVASFSSARALPCEFIPMYFLFPEPAAYQTKTWKLVSVRPCVCTQVSV